MGEAKEQYRRDEEHGAIEAKPSSRLTRYVRWFH
jgi:hypothetical protein